MALYPFDLSLGIAQLSSQIASAAVGLANGYDTVAAGYTVAAGGTNYSLGDQVKLTGGTGTAAVFFVVGVNNGVVTAVSHIGNFGCTPLSGFWISASTPGTGAIATTNIKVAKSTATGLTINITYTVGGIPKGCQSAILQASSIGGQGIIFTTDGTTPSSSNGIVVASGVSWSITTDPANVLVIAGGSGAVANVLFLASVGNTTIGQ